MTLLFGPVIKSASYLANSKLSSSTFLMEMLDHSLDNSQDKDDENCITIEKEIITAQSLTIVEEDGSLGSAEDQSAVAELAHTQGLLDQCEDDEVQYQFRSGEGTVTYRVVQVGSGDQDPLPQIVSTSPSFSGSSSGVLQGQVLSSPLNGQFYVIGSPQDVFGSQNSRTLAPRSGLHIENTRGASVSRETLFKRDDRRRATHNEVERRRRDKINQWIMELSKLIPGCSPDNAKTGQSKGGILAKACEHIKDLRHSNSQLLEMVNDNKRMSMELEMLRQENDEHKRNNELLRNQLRQHGIIPSPDISSSTS